MEGELRGKGEMEIPLKLAIVEDAMCRTETTNPWLQIHSRKEGCLLYSTPYPCTPAWNLTAPKGLLFSGT